VQTLKVCGTFENGHYKGKEFGRAAFDALVYGIALIGVKIGVARDGFIANQVVVNPMRKSGIPFIIDEHDVIFYVCGVRAAPWISPSPLGFDYISVHLLQLHFSMRMVTSSMFAVL
jgi:hypothetical protein